MGLVDYFFKSDAQKALLVVLLLDGVEASAYDLSRLSGLSYSTTYYELEKLADAGVVRSRKRDGAILFRSNLDETATDALAKLFGQPASAVVESRAPSAEQVKVSLLQGGAPLVLDTKSKAADCSVEELLVWAALLAKKESAVARVLPVFIYKNLQSFDFAKLYFWSKQLAAKHEVGLFVSLAGELGNSGKLVKEARRFRDKRVKETREFFLNQSSSSQRELAERNTPPLARQWKFRMNMSMDSFRSTFERSGA